MGTQQNVPKTKSQVKFLELTCLFRKKTFYKPLQYFTIDCPFKCECGRWVFSFNYSLGYTTKYFRQTKVINFSGTSHRLFRSDKITDQREFPKKPQRRVLKYSSFLFFRTFFSVKRFCCLNHLRFSLPFLLNAKSPIFAVGFCEQPLELTKGSLFLMKIDASVTKSSHQMVVRAIYIYIFFALTCTPLPLENKKQL